MFLSESNDIAEVKSHVKKMKVDIFNCLMEKNPPKTSLKMKVL